MPIRCLSPPLNAYGRRAAWLADSPTVDGSSAPMLKCLATSRVSMIGPPASPAAPAAWASLAAVTVVSASDIGLEREPAGVGPAVDLEHRPGDVARLPGGQEQHRVRDVRR